MYFVPHHPAKPFQSTDGTTEEGGVSAIGFTTGVEAGGAAGGFNAGVEVSGRVEDPLMASRDMAAKAADIIIYFKETRNKDPSL